MLIPILISARDNASQALKGIAASFQSLTSNAENAAKAAGHVNIKDVGTSKIVALREEIGLSTQALRANQAAETLRASKANAGFQASLVNERRQQHEFLQTEKSARMLGQSESRLAAARSRASLASDKFNLNASKAGLADLEKSFLGVERTGSGLGRLSSMLGNILPGQLGTLASSGGGAFGSITSGITGSELAIGGLVGAVGLGLVGAFMAAGAAASYFGDQFSKSVDRQKELIAQRSH